MQLFSYLVTIAVNNLVIFVFINFVLDNSKLLKNYSAETQHSYIPRGDSCHIVNSLYRDKCLFN